MRNVERLRFYCISHLECHWILIMLKRMVKVWIDKFLDWLKPHHSHWNTFHLYQCSEQHLNANYFDSLSFLFIVLTFFRSFALCHLSYLCSYHRLQCTTIEVPSFSSALPTIHDITYRFTLTNNSTPEHTHTHQKDPFAIMRIDFFALRQRVSCKKGRRRNHLIEMLYCLQPFTTTAFHMCFGSIGTAFVLNPFCNDASLLLQQPLPLFCSRFSIPPNWCMNFIEQKQRKEVDSRLFSLVIVFNTEQPMPFPIIVTSVTTITTYTYTQIAFVYHRTQC